MNMHETMTAGSDVKEHAPAKTGPRIYNLFPLLAGPVSAWRAELPRIARMNFDWVYVNPFHEAGFSGSLYAIKDPSRLDPRFRDPDGGTDDAQIRRFVLDAERLGLKVMADLVINHTSKDALLVQQMPEVFVRDEAGELVSPHAIDPVDPSIKTEWGDLAELDYGTAENRRALVRHFDDYVRHLQVLGFKGFRCDAAYKVPPEVWDELIRAAKMRDEDALFVAETLGCTLEETRAVAGAGFDYLFNSFAWWDLKAPWALADYERLRLLAPSVAFPENHDMPRLAEEIGETDPQRVAQILKGRYALAACFSSGVLMPMGYEFGYRRPLHVVETRPEHREETGIDISESIAAVNAVRAELPALNTEGAQVRLGPPEGPFLALLRTDTGHPVSARAASLVIANLRPAETTVEAGPLLAQTGWRFGGFADQTPGSHGRTFAPGDVITLAPGEVRIFAASAPAVDARPVRAEELEPTGEGRVLIEAVSPEIDGGRTPLKRIAGEAIEVTADIYSDGHDKLAAEILYRAADEVEWRRAPMAFVDNDRWSGRFALERNVRYFYTIEAWRDVYGSWRSEVEKKRAAGVDVRLETIEGMRLVERARAAGGGGAMLDGLVRDLVAVKDDPRAQLELLLSPENADLLSRHGERGNVSRYDRNLEVVVDRLAARFSAWYELFPRSQSGDPTRHGTFDDVIRRLPYVRDLGFDVLYFTPIHPIGVTNRKGKNNSLKAEPGDVGSVYAIGSAEGGHTAIHRELGTLEDFRRLVREAENHGLEIALDFAIQCSPDHPWIKEHPEWFDWRPDGTIRFAENPPKKYEDIVNVHFYGEALPSLWYELRDAFLFWAEQGVKIFRVDNPHTKPIPFWEWMIREVNDAHPDVLFLAEAFTRPKMMRKLAKVGFQQSYTYFTWRNTKAEIMEYSRELAADMGEYYRPNFFANTPDINPIPLQTSGRAGFVIRGTLAATLSSVYGIYNGFELCEGRPVPGKEEYIDSEKYELKAWDYDRPGNIKDHIAKLNRIRRENPALWDFRNVLFLNAWNDQIVAYARLTPAKDNCVMILVNLDPKNRQECSYEVPLWEFGLPDHASIEAEDLLNGGRFTLHGKTHRIALEPAERPVAIWRLIPPGAT